MALGGGTWQFQNKILPGTYINFVSKVRAEAAIADRGYATMAITGSWGPAGKVFAVTAEDFQTNSLKLFGYDYAADELKGLRDLFINAKTVYFYRLDNGSVKASNDLATAVYTGARGNDISVAVAVNVDDETQFDVSTYITLDGVKTLLDKQTGAAWEDIEDNDYVVFKTHDETALEAVAATPLTGGSDGDAVTSAQYQSYLDAISPYYFNTMGYAGTDKSIQSLMVTFTKRMRDETGAKFQTVLYNYEGADHEGIISLANAVEDEGASPAAAVYWLTGAEASCAVNASLTNAIYDGEYTINTEYSKSELERLIQTGYLAFYNDMKTVSGELVSNVRVLRDINTFVSTTKKKTDDFAMNQVIRVLDQVAIDFANLFNTTYLGKELNDSDGRKALWGDGVYLLEEYQRVRAIQNFDPDELELPTQGTKKNAVLWDMEIQPTCAMEMLYMAVVVA